MHYTDISETMGLQIRTPSFSKRKAHNEHRPPRLVLRRRSAEHHCTADGCFLASAHALNQAKTGLFKKLTCENT